MAKQVERPMREVYERLNKVLSRGLVDDGIDCSGVVHDEMGSITFAAWDNVLEDRTSFGPINWDLGRRRFGDGV